jgi:predicted metal-binding membrane protein
LPAPLHARTAAEYHGVEALLRRDRLLVWCALILVTTLAWAYLLRLYLQMDAMPSAMAMTAIKHWSASDVILMFAMWTIMMVGMMLPSAAPMILLYSQAQRQQASTSWCSPVAAFSLGYLAIWTLFSAAATALQWMLQREALLSPMMVSNNQAFSGVLLIAAGIYQCSPLKQACLRQCRSPLLFIQHYWRNGTLGAFSMGLRHGAYCLGCCWSLMLLLFVAGVMNLLWVALLSVFVLTEKLFYHRLLHTWGSALGLILAGVLILAAPG